MLMALVFLGPRGAPEWVFPRSMFGSAAGSILLLAGLSFLVAGTFQLGSKLTPLPYPGDHAKLIVTGPYSLVRHPMYSGGILMAFGWAILVHSWLTLGYAVLLILFLDVKSRREERWLCENFADYSAYQKRIRKLMPFIY
jgi:protein-S-isoprenylcysteine O-methyltransferase Ste14